MNGGITERVARACATHPWRTFAAWALTLVAAFGAIGLLLGDNLTTEARVTGDPEYIRAGDEVARAFPSDRQRSVSDIVVVRSERHTIDSREFRAFVGRLRNEGRATGAVDAARTFYDTGDETLVSRDRHATIVPILVPDVDEVEPVIEVVERADKDAEFSVAMTGETTLDHDFNKLSQSDLKEGELQFGLPAALIVLLLVFGAVVAGLVPLLMALVLIVVALGLTALVGEAAELSVFVVNMLTGMGLALGIDYSLFVISRYREERGRGREPFDAIAAAGGTASRAVLFSGTAFVVAMFGMLIVPSTIMRSLAVGAILVGITSVLAALTLLPALLGLVGDRVNALRIPFFGGASGRAANPEGRFWRAVIDRVMRRPVTSLLVSAALLLAAAAPVFDLHIGTSGVSTLPDRFVSRQGFAALQRDFPGVTTDPVDIVVVGNASAANVREGIESLRNRLAVHDAFGTSELRRSESGDVAVVTVPVRGDPTSPEAVSAVRALRTDVIPEVFGDADTEVLVGGTTAENIEYFDAVTDPAPLVFAFVLGLTFVLLTIVFRSLVIAAKAILLNLLSVGAAYGLLVLVFQHGVGSGFFGFTEAEAVEAWVPLFLFSVLFGLSMDYHVFLLSRIKERWDETGDTGGAVTWGVASTARIITGAALIIVVVFIGFAMGDLIMFQQMGFGVAVALLLDATLIRSVLLPATMELLGRWNWYLPAWLEWLPHLEIEGRQPGRGQPARASGS